MSQFKDIVKKKSYEYERKRFIEALTLHLGKVVETDNELICYINPKKMIKDKYDLNICIPTESMIDAELIEKYALNKPVKYILEGINTKKYVCIANYSDKVYLDIRSCNFSGFGFILKSKGKCMISNTNIRSYSMANIISDDLTINNLKIDTVADKFTTIIAGDNKLNIKGLVINRVYSKIANLYLYSEGILNISKTNLNLDEVNIEARDITSDIDTIIKSRNIIIQNNNEIDNLRLKSPNTTYNGIPLRKNDTNNIELTLTPLFLKRISLIEILKKLKEQCEKEIQEPIQSYKKRLEQQVVAETLKKN